MRVLTTVWLGLILIGLFVLSGCSKANQAAEQTKTLEHYTVTLKTEPLKVGENPLRLSIQALHGSLPKDLKVSVKTVMPSMSDMAVPEPTVEKEADGQYTAKANFVMAGEWDLSVSLANGAGKPETAQFQVKAAE